MVRIHDPTDPANLTPDDRVAEIAAMLASAILRLRERAALDPAVAPQPPIPETESNQLDLSEQKSVHGQRG